MAAFAVRNSGGAGCPCPVLLCFFINHEHLLPEMTANIVGALAVLVLLFLEDWRMGLSMLIVVPLGIGCFMSMFSGYHEKFQRTVTATKALNDTAVEYISGIEVIKAFGQSKTSYGQS